MSEEALATNLQIGDLLVRSGLISAELLDEVNRLAFKMRLPIGRILTMHGHIADNVLTQALEIQSRIKDRALPIDHGVRALQLIARDGLPLEEALSRVMPKPVQTKPVPTSNRLGEILMEAGYATPIQVKEALPQTVETGLPLGIILYNKGIITRAGLPLGIILYNKGIITRAGLYSSLCAQKLIRQNAADRDRIIYALKMARLRSTPLTNTLRENQIDSSILEQEFGVAEILVLAGVISESQLLTAKEIEVVEDKPLAQVIVENGFATEPCMHTVTQILNMIKEGILFEDQAAQIVKRIQHITSYDELNKTLASLDELQDELEESRPTYDVPEILKKAGLISDKEIQIATAMALANRQSLLKTLCDAKLVTEKNMELASQCKIYLDHNLIQLEQAAIALIYAIDNNLTIDETLDCFGWSAPVG